MRVGERERERGGGEEERRRREKGRERDNRARGDRGGERRRESRGELKLLLCVLQESSLKTTFMPWNEPLSKRVNVDNSLVAHYLTFQQQFPVFSFFLIFVVFFAVLQKVYIKHSRKL